MVAREILKRVQRARRGRLPGVEQFVQVVAHQIQQEGLFVGRIKIKRADLHTDLRRDLAHGNGGIAVACDQPQGGGTDFRSGLVGGTADATGHDPGRYRNARAVQGAVRDIWTWRAGPGILRPMRRLIFALTLLPLACGPSLPDLDARLSDAGRAQDFPSLVPLDPLLAQIEAPLPRSAADEGTSLEARALDLRRRAAWLRNLPL